MSYKTIILENPVKDIFIHYADEYFGYMRGSMSSEYEKEFALMKEQAQETAEFKISTGFFDGWFGKVFYHAFSGSRMEKEAAIKLHELFTTWYKGVHPEYRLEKYM